MCCINSRLAECVLSCSGMIAGWAEYVPPCPGSIPSRKSVFCHVICQFFGKQSVFCHVLGQFFVDRVCSVKSISGQQRVFRHVPGEIPVGSMCSATAWVDFWLAEYVLPCPGSISGRQSVFHHVLGQFVITFVQYIAISWVNSQLAECILPCTGAILLHYDIMDAFICKLS